MSKLFLLPGAVKTDSDVEHWFEIRKRDLGEIAEFWFNQIRQCGVDVTEVLHDGHPTACVNSAAFAYVNAFSFHVNVGFFHGASLPDPSGILEGNGKFMRHVKIRPSAPINEVALQQLIHSAYKDIKARVHSDFTS